MTESEFRILHSKLIEEYQLIEMHLQGLCAAIANEPERFLEYLGDYRFDSFGVLLQKLEKLQSEKTVKVLSAEERKSLKNVQAARNYWSHECFSVKSVGEVGIVFKKNRGRAREGCKATKT